MVESKTYGLQYNISIEPYSVSAGCPVRPMPKVDYTEVSHEFTHY